MYDGVAIALEPLDGGSWPKARVATARAGPQLSGGKQRGSR